MKNVIAHGADVNAKNNKGMSAMAMARAVDNDEIADLLRANYALL